jgi:hypothetical protein
MYLGFGQKIGVASPVLAAEVGGPYWSQYPSDWRPDLAGQIRPSTVSGGSPSGWNLVPVNLAKMLKRMEEIDRGLAALRRPA